MTGTTNIVALGDFRFVAHALPEAVRAIGAAAATVDRFHTVVTPNAAHFARLANASPALRATYTEADFCCLDSRVLAGAIRLAGRRPPPVIPGSDLFAALLESAIGPETSLCIIGGEPKIVAALCRRFQLTRVQHLNPSIGFWRDPAEMAAIVRFIVRAQADYTVLAVGSPQQEQVAGLVRQAGGARGVGLCIGAGLAFAAGATRRAPALLRRAGLEWAWRLALEPRRMARRYLVESPRGVLHAWRLAGAASRAPGGVARMLAFAAGLVVLGAASPRMTPLYSFAGGSDGGTPAGRLALDRFGHLFGVTIWGGDENNGVLFALSPRPDGPGDWRQIWHASIPAADGQDHAGGVAWRAPHTLITTSVAGGAAGCGAVIAATPQGTSATVPLHTFGLVAGDGCHPTEPPAAGANGVWYGATAAGGAHGMGTLYALRRSSAAALAPVIWNFSGPDGEQPGGAPQIGPDGTLYGIAYNGGAQGYGTAWALHPPATSTGPWRLATLWSFTGAPDCAHPAPGTLIRDKAGDLFGACQAGGQGYGGIFELSPPLPGTTAWRERMLVAGNAKNGTVVDASGFAPDGRIIATSALVANGSIEARVLALTVPPPGQTANFATLARIPDAALLHVLIGPGGVLYGTTPGGGPANAGTVWSISP